MSPPAVSNTAPADTSTSFPGRPPTTPSNTPTWDQPGRPSASGPVDLLRDEGQSGEFSRGTTLPSGPALRPRDWSSSRSGLPAFATHSAID